MARLKKAVMRASFLPQLRLYTRGADNDAGTFEGHSHS